MWGSRSSCADVGVEVSVTPSVVDHCRNLRASIMLRQPQSAIASPASVKNARIKMLGFNGGLLCVHSVWSMSIAVTKTAASLQSRDGNETRDEEGDAMRVPAHLATRALFRVYQCSACACAGRILGTNSMYGVAAVWPGGS